MIKIMIDCNRFRERLCINCQVSGWLWAHRSRSDSCATGILHSLSFGLPKPTASHLCTHSNQIPLAPAATLVFPQLSTLQPSSSVTHNALTPTWFLRQILVQWLLCSTVLPQIQTPLRKKSLSLSLHDATTSVSHSHRKFGFWSFFSISVSGQWMLCSWDE